MALATTCPACSTSFKVNPEQLKLRRGLVRCGKCEHVFSGVEYLRYVSDSQTDADLNPPDTGGDRRKGDRRSTRRSLPDDDVGDTDDLKTAFFLPETELQEPDSADLAEIAFRDADPDSDSGSDSDSDSSDDDAQAAPSPTAATPGKKRSRKNRRRKRARAQAAAGTATPDASEPDVLPPQTDASATDDAGTQSGFVTSDPAEAPQPAGNASTAEQNNRGDNASESEEAGDSDSGDGSARPVNPPPVRTVPLTQSPRTRANGKSGRNDTNWIPAPVWPSIDEHFEDPDIEEPDSAPGPRPLDGPASPSQAADGATQAERTQRTTDEDAIDFFGQTSKPTFDFDLPSGRAWLIAVALLVLLLVQLVVGNRDVLASRFPAMSSAISTLSSPFGLEVRLPMDSDSIKIASFDLVTASTREPDASYVMNLLMRNKASYTVRWPAIELTLLDDAGGILVRKILPAEQYISDPFTLKAGLPASSEHPIRVGLKSRTSAPVGYSVSLFYP